MKAFEKKRAVELRKAGRTYGEILKDLPVSRGSLSCWLRDVALGPEQAARIEQKNSAALRKLSAINERRKRASQEGKRRLAEGAAKEIRGISEQELKLIGIALYWAEGYKRSGWRTVCFANSEPQMIILMMRWFRQVCGVPEKKFRIRIQGYDADGVRKSQSFWSRVTGVPLSQFSKPYVRISPTSQGKMETPFIHGTCSIRISDASLLVKIKGWINGLAALSSSPVQDVSFSS